MPIGTAVTDPHLAQFISVTELVSHRYAGQLAGWTDSPFAWILTLPSRSRGAAGEAIVDQWLTQNGFAVRPPRSSDCDRIVNGHKLEIKFSTLWRSGGYKFQQLRDQDYESVLCLGVSPHDVHAWFIPKRIAWENSRPQHGGSAGVDTRWLCFQADAPPTWLKSHGGKLSDVLEIIRTRI